MQTGAQSLPVMLVGRCIGGYAASVIYAVYPMYASEIAQSGGLYAFNTATSYALTEWMELGLSYITTDVAWRLFFGL